MQRGLLSFYDILRLWFRSQKLPHDRPEDFANDLRIHRFL